MSGVQDEGLPVGRSTRKARWRVVLAWLLIAVAAGSLTYVLRVPASAGDEVDTTSIRAGTVISWSTWKDSGTTFTDASVHLAVQRGEIRIKSVDVDITGNSVQRLGRPMIARMLPDAPDFPDTLPEFPPSDQDVQRLKLGPVQPAEGATLSVAPGQKVTYYILFFGLRVVGDGRSVRTEPVVTYHVDGRLRRRSLRMNSTMAVCSPRTHHLSESCLDS